MKYKYYDQRGRLLCEADSPITFNLFLYPIWKYIKCVIDEDEDKVEVVVARIIPTKDDIKTDSEATVKRKTTTKRRKKTGGSS